MKKYLLLSLLSIGLLAGCPSLKGPYKKDPIEVEGSNSVYGLQAHQILIEANRLADLVNKNQITRVQAAQSLDLYRVQLVGHNAVDDAVFATYLRIAVDRQNNKADAAASQERMQKELNKWQARWPKLKNKPDNPAFANFLMQVFQLPPLTR